MLRDVCWPFKELDNACTLSLVSSEGGEGWGEDIDIQMSVRREEKRSSDGVLLFLCVEMGALLLCLDAISCTQLLFDRFLRCLGQV